ncbi:MAG: phage major capsid protein [Bryobacteraceae bacterium]
MAGLTMTTADAVLKEDYLPGIREQLNNDTFLAFAEKNSESVSGRRAVLALHVSRSSGIGARADNAPLPTAGAQGYTDQYVPVFRNYGRLQVSGQTIKAMVSDQTSFIRAVRGEMDGLTNDLRNSISRQIFGTSDGVIADTGVTSNSTTVVMNGTLTQMRSFYVGQTIDIGVPPAYASVAAGLTITGITLPAMNAKGGTLTVSSAVTTTVSDVVSATGSGGSGAAQVEVTGLQSIVSATGTVFGVNPTTYPIWASYVDSNGGVLRSITEQSFTRAQMAAHIAGGANIDVWVCSDGVQRAYANLLIGLKRFTNTVDLKGGYQGLTADAQGVGQAPVTWDRYCPSNTAYGLRTTNYIEFMESDWEWMDNDGAVLSRVPGYDAYEATLFKYCEFATDKRNAHAAVTDITES